MIDALATLYRSEHARVLSSVLARVRDFPLAEEAVQDAFASAAEKWREASPPNPRAWLIRVATNKAIDRARRRAKFPEIGAEALDAIPAVALIDSELTVDSDAEVSDERLRLIFTCCHPALSPDAQVALTLRTVAGLSTEEIARLFFSEPKAIAQRLVRAQRKIKDACIPYVVPGPDKIEERLAAALAVIYLVFTEGYGAVVRTELCDEALRLARLVVELLPKEPEARALLALMLLHDARREARIDGGELVRLEDQDRGRWDEARIADGLLSLDAALVGGASGPYALQAAIAGLHARARRREDTDWPQILALYDMLLAVQSTPVVELNRAVAVAMAIGIEDGLKALDAMRLRLDDNHLYHAARADLLLRLGRTDEARRAYRAALRYVVHPAERRFLEKRLALITSR